MLALFRTHLWIKIFDIPREAAIAHACCPPAPPKVAKTCFAVSYPLACVRALIGLHIASLATVINPIATSSVVKGSLALPLSS